MKADAGTQALMLSRLSAAEAGAIEMVLDGLPSKHSRRAYERALLDFFHWHRGLGRPQLNKALVQRYAAELRDAGASPSSVNLRLSAIRKLAAEAADNGALDPVVANGIRAVKEARSEGRRTGNWLTREQSLASGAYHAARIGRTRPWSPRPAVDETLAEFNHRRVLHPRRQLRLPNQPRLDPPSRQRLPRRAAVGAGQRVRYFTAVDLVEHLHWFPRFHSEALNHNSRVHSAGRCYFEVGSPRPATHHGVVSRFGGDHAEGVKGNARVFHLGGGRREQHVAVPLRLERPDHPAHRGINVTF